jgi:magnesium-protoporphyrin O-methyltransferase
MTAARAGRGRGRRGNKEAVRAYFNPTGFERWRKIYGSATEGVNRVQLDIREGQRHSWGGGLTFST